MRKHDADLKLVDILQDPTGTCKATGEIFNDSRGRFEDGVLVTTSYVVSVEMIEGFMYIQTRNTLYRVTNLTIAED